jgi:hypothetical protein
MAVVVSRRMNLSTAGVRSPLGGAVAQPGIGAYFCLTASVCTRPGSSGECQTYVFGMERGILNGDGYKAWRP